MLGAKGAEKLELMSVSSGDLHPASILQTAGYILAIERVEGRLHQHRMPRLFIAIAC